MATNTLDFKQLNTPPHLYQKQPRECIFNLGEMIINTDMRNPFYRARTLKRKAFKSAVRANFEKDLKVFLEVSGINNEDDYLRLYDKTIKKLNEINSGLIAIEPTEEGLLVSSRKNGKAIYMDLSLNGNSVFLSMLSDDHTVQNITTTLYQAIFRSNIFFYHQ